MCILTSETPFLSLVKLCFYVLKIISTNELRLPIKPEKQRIINYKLD